MIEFDPDELYLDKNYVVGLLKLIEKRWKLTNTNPIYIAGLKAFRIGLRHTPDKIFKTFWKQVLTLLNDLQYENAKAGARSRGELWINTLEKIPDKIEQGVMDIKEDSKDDSRLD